MLMQTDNSFRFLKTIISDIDFKNILNLREFPFDNHEMKIDIINKDKINFRLDEVYLGQNRYWQDYIKNNKLSDWKINDTSIDLAHFHNKEFSSGIDSYFFRIGYNEKYKNAEKKIFTIFVEREYNYYLIKILIPIIIILIVCWSVFWINISQIESRLTISVVCLLALIAYNVIVADSLPMIGYATVMDYIILSSYVLGALSTLLTVIFYNFHVRDYDIIRTEKITRLTLPVIYIAIVYGIIDYNIARLDTAVIGKFLLGLLNF